MSIIFPENFGRGNDISPFSLPKIIFLFVFLVFFVNFCSCSNLSISIVTLEDLNISLGFMDLSGSAGSGFDVYESSPMACKIVITNNGTITENYAIEFRREDFLWNDSLNISVRIPGTTSYREIGVSPALLISDNCSAGSEKEYYIQYKLNVTEPVNSSDYSTTIYYLLTDTD